MRDHQRVLIIDHSEMVRELVCSRLEELEVELVTAENGSAGLAAARHLRPDLILLDVTLPDMTGFEVRQQLADDPTVSDIPVIYLSASDDPDDRVRAFEHGGVDCIIKPFYGDEMRARVRLALQTRSLMHRLETQAHCDALTGLPNRARLTERLNLAIARSRKEDDYNFAVLFLDFDRFKIINDSLGHDVGDMLLVSIAHRLGDNIRGGDTTHVPARLGGDEFVLLLDGISKCEDAVFVAERLQRALCRPHQLGEHEVTSTASIGIVTSSGRYERADDVLRDADTAMYHAKSSGKNRHVIFDERMHEEVVERLKLEGDLREAVEQGQFALAYQPIVELTSGELVGFEALLRWTHPVRGNVPPARFIGLAEELGLIIPIGTWALKEAATQLKSWHDAFPSLDHLTMNVNLSKAQIRQRDLAETIARTIEHAGLDTSKLKLEVTESIIMDAPEEIPEMLESLRDLGVGMCMDDFGTGHSSLACMHKFPIDVLKIDRSFVVNTDENREYAAVIHAIVTLAHTLNMVVVGEGVETGGQVAQLQALECDLAQGNFFSKPMRADAATAYLKGPRGLARSA